MEFKDNSRSVLSALDKQIEKALEMCGLVAEGHAQKECLVDTGNLRNSITHKTGDDIVTVGTNVHYAPYVEFGTGIHSERGGRQTPWGLWKGKDGFFHANTQGMKPHPFIKPSIAEHMDEYKKIFKQTLKG